MTLILSAVSLMISSQLAFSKDCAVSAESLQKKLITQHIFRYPLTYGKDIEVTKIEAIHCDPEGPNQYLVFYSDIACYELQSTQAKVVKCQKVYCHNSAFVTQAGAVDFDLAASKSCSREK